MLFRIDPGSGVAIFDQLAASAAEAGPRGRSLRLVELKSATVPCFEGTGAVAAPLHLSPRCGER